MHRQPRLLVGLGLAFLLAASGCLSSPPDETNSSADGLVDDPVGPPGDEREQAPSNSTVVSLTLQVEYGAAYPGKEDVEVRLTLAPTAHPSGVVLDRYDREHPGHPTPLDALVAWSNQAEVPLAFEPDAPIPKEIDGVGQPVDSQLPPWWCYDLNGEKSGEPSWGMAVVSGDTVRYFFGDCGGPT